MDALIDANQKEVDISTCRECFPHEIKVNIRAPKRDFVHVSVHDTGPRIDAEVMDRLFNPLVTTKPSGMGIGLSVCHSIIEAHGGKLWAENDTDGSAVFHFTETEVS